MLENCLVIFDEERKIITSAWSGQGRRVYCAPPQDINSDKIR